MGPALGVTTWFLPERGLRGLRWAHEAGFTAVHLDHHDLVHVSADAYAAEAMALGIRIAGVAVVALEAIGLGDHLRACLAIGEAVRDAVRLGAPLVYLPAFGDAEVRSTPDAEALAALARRTVEVAGPSTVVALETPLCESALDDLFARIGSPDVRLLLDTQNPVLWGCDVTAIASRFGARVAAVHVKDGRGAMGNTRIGDGDADVAGTLAVLARRGYAGGFVVESDYRDGNLDAARQDRETVRRLWSTAEGSSTASGDWR